MASPENENASHRSILTIVLIVVVIASISGLFMGMRQNDNNKKTWHSPWLAGPEAQPSEQKAFPVAPKYADIPTTKWKANKSWHNSLADLPHVKENLAEQKVLTPKERQKILAERSSRRAYDGAPPMIPHAINFRDINSCSACHAPDSDVVIAGRRSPVMSHPMMSNCTQCHAPNDGLKMLQHSGTVGLVVESGFIGNSRMGRGSRAYKGAPPTIPHRVSMRQNCMSCHGAGMPDAITTPHPMRKNCMQCHAQDADYDNREMLAEPLAPWEREKR